MLSKAFFPMTRATARLAAALCLADLRRTLCDGAAFPDAFANGLRVVDVFQDQSGAVLMRVVVDRC